MSERVRILENCGQKSLAYLTAATHGLDSEQERLAESFDNNNEILPEPDCDAQLFESGIPIVPNESSNWPLLSVSKGFFANIATGVSPLSTNKDTNFAMMRANDHDDQITANNNWGDDAHLEIHDENYDDDANDDDYVRVVQTDDNLDGTKGWDVDDDLDIGDVVLPARDDHPHESSSQFFTAPTKGISRQQIWLNNSKLAVDHILAGSFETAMRLLHDQVGIVNFDELKPIFMQTYSRSRTCFTGLPSLSPLFTYPCKNPNDAATHKSLPVVGLKLADLVQRLQSAYQFVTNGKFPESIELFRHVFDSTL